MSTQMQSVLSTQNVALPTGFAKLKKSKKICRLARHCTEKETTDIWDSFLSSTQVEMWGSKRYPEHPMNSVFHLYLDELARIQGDDDAPVIEDACGHTECDKFIPQYLDEETGDLIDGRDEYCSDTCREAQSVLEDDDEEDEEMQECDKCLVHPHSAVTDSCKFTIKKHYPRGLLTSWENLCSTCEEHVKDEEQEFEAEYGRALRRDTLTYWQCKIAEMMFIHNRVHPVAKIMKRPSSIALASLMTY